MPGFVQRQAGAHLAARVDHCADAGVGGPDHGQAELDRPEPGLDEVLVGAGEGADLPGARQTTIYAQAGDWPHIVVILLALAALTGRRVMKPVDPASGDG